MSAKIPYARRMKQIETLTPRYPNISQFYKYNSYLYKWTRWNHVDLKPYFPPRKKKKTEKPVEKKKKGVDCYKARGRKVYKHFDSISEASRKLGIKYHYIYKVVKGKLPSINGYRFVKCQ